MAITSVWHCSCNSSISAASALSIWARTLCTSATLAFIVSWAFVMKLTNRAAFPLPEGNFNASSTRNCWAIILSSIDFAASPARTCATLSFSFCLSNSRSCFSLSLFFFSVVASSSSVCRRRASARSFGAGEVRPPSSSSSSSTSVASLFAVSTAVAAWSRRSWRCFRKPANCLKWPTWCDPRAANAAISRCLIWVRNNLPPSSSDPAPPVATFSNLWVCLACI
mmetsp:Transcript_55486/g.180071  ORF Transcript_55486/g.180071 Transcript_55486/m.180071 type:complete len:224 (-) Transcript_55486:86-757(-)